MSDRSRSPLRFSASLGSSSPFETLLALVDVVLLSRSSSEPESSISFLSWTTSSPSEECKLGVLDPFERGEPKGDLERSDIFSGVGVRDGDLECFRGDLSLLLDLFDLGLCLGDTEVPDIGLGVADILAVDGCSDARNIWTCYKFSFSFFF